MLCYGIIHQRACTFARSLWAVSFSFKSPNWNKVCFTAQFIYLLIYWENKTKQKYWHENTSFSNFHLLFQVEGKAQKFSTKSSMIILNERKRFSADIANASRFVLYQIGKLSNKNCDWVKGDWGLRPTLAPFARGWRGVGRACIITSSTRLKNTAVHTTLPVVRYCESVPLCRPYFPPSSLCRQRNIQDYHLRG